MNRTIKAVLPHFRLSPAEILASANAVYGGLKGNAAFPTPVVDLNALKEDIANLTSATAAAQGGGIQLTAERNRIAHSLVKGLRQLGHYVESHCNEDLATLISSGFVAATSVRTAVPPLSQSIRRIDPGANSGQMLISLVKTPGAHSYELRWAPVINGSPSAWTTQAAGSTRPATPITNLTPGATYAFQARALRRSGFTDWSDSVTRISM